jgi:hypothetical protein
VQWLSLGLDSGVGSRHRLLSLSRARAEVGRLRFLAVDVGDDGDSARFEPPRMSSCPGPCSKGDGMLQAPAPTDWRAEGSVQADLKNGGTN